MTASAHALIDGIATHHRGTGSGAQRAVLVGLLGRGIGASRSPEMHRREGARLGLRYTYELIDFDDLDLPDSALGDVLDRLETAGFAGCNVTHPFKQLVSHSLTDLAPDAAAIGAVNTVVFDGGSRLGHNTDAWGFAESFRVGMSGCDLTSVALFGAGGGGAAVGHALLQLGVEALDIHDPDAARAQKLAQALSARFAKAVGVITEPDKAVPQATGVVNATPIGMTKYPGAPFDLDLLGPKQWVADIVYFPPETELLRRARTLGCRALPGTGMAVLQAVKAFELFAGIAPDREAMTHHFEAAA